MKEEKVFFNRIFPIGFGLCSGVAATLIDNIALKAVTIIATLLIGCAIRFLADR